MSAVEEPQRLEDSRKQQLVQISPKYVRLRQGSKIRYCLKATRPPSKGKSVTIHVRVTMNKSGITVLPTHVIVTAKDWRQAREITVTSSADSELRTYQIHHNIHERCDDVYNGTAVLPSLFVSVLQKKTTFLFGFGCGLDGRLGTNRETDTTTPTPIPCRWLHPLQLACGKAHSAIVDVYSNLYCFGLGSRGQLGQGNGNFKSSQEPLRIPQLVATSVHYVACGSNHTLCLTTDTRVFAWGDNSSGQLGMGFKTTKPVDTPYRIDKLIGIQTIACGGAQSFIITKTNVLACGSNVAGQLGIGDCVDRTSFKHIPFFRKLCYASDPCAGLYNDFWSMSTEVEALPGGIRLFCGTYHTMALSEGRVFSWGIGDDGRLGHGDHESCLVPTLVNSLKDTHVKALACGGSHSGAIAVNGDVFTWGSGSLGQLGLGKTRSRCVPTRVRVLAGMGVTQLSFGEWHSMALCQDGTVFAWGFGEEGQLGHSGADLGSTRRIALVPAIVHALSRTGASMIACGGSHTFVVTTQENRRRQAAQIGRRASQLHAQQQEQKAAATTTLACRLSRGMSYECRTIEQTLPVPASDKAKATQLCTKSGPARRCHSARRADPCPQPVAAAVIKALSWKSRPLHSRLSVRNALRQHKHEATEWQEAMTSSEVLPPRTQSRLGIFPRLLRLCKEGRRRTPSDNAVTTQAVADAVHTATEDCLRLGSMCHYEVPRSPKPPISLAWRVQSDDEVAALPLTKLIDDLRVHSAAPLDDVLTDDVHEEESDDGIPLFAASRTFDNCQAMETDIRNEYLQ